MNNPRFAWIPEAPKYPGVYAALKSNHTNGRNCTVTAEEALQFNTKEECEEWCKNNPHPVFEPREHGFYA